MGNPRRLLHEVVRHDLAHFIHYSFCTVSPGEPFYWNWHLGALAWHLQQCLAGKIRRLIITLPPRNLKSISASIAFPAFVLGRDPTMRIICASYSAELAAKLARDCRRIMKSPWYRRAFPKTQLSQEKNAELDFMTTEQGFRFSTSVGGTLTGRGGKMLIVDDPMKPDEAMSEAFRKSRVEWFDNTLCTRLDDKRTGCIIVIMQRLHLNDLVGHLLEKGGWTHLNLPAIAEVEERIQIGPDRFHVRKVGDLLHAEREPLHVLDEMKRNIGSFNFAAQYQQSPIPEDGELIKWEWFQAYDSEPGRAAHDRIIQSWDTASKSNELNDYSVCTTWLIKDKDYFLLDLFRAKLIYPDLKRAVADQARRFQSQTVLIEDKASGTALIQDLRQSRAHGPGSVIAIQPDGDKVTRASAQSAAIEAGRVHLPARAGWLADLRAEILQFPHGRHDDQVDSITQFLHWAENRHRRMAYSVPVTGTF